MPPFTADEISALRPGDCFVRVDNNFCNDVNVTNDIDDVAYRMPDFETAQEYFLLCIRLLSASQEKGLDEDAAVIICAEKGHYSTTQYPQLFKTPEISTLPELQLRLQKALQALQTQISFNQPPNP